MARGVVIDTTRLREALGQGFRLDGEVQRQLADVLAKHAIEWTIKLKGPTLAAPGEGIWPVGSIVNLGQRNERYVAPGSPGGRDSGRSLQGWDIDQKGLTIQASNTAVDAKRNAYAEFVHFAGEPTGKAVDDAFDAFRQSFEKDAADKMADVIERALRGRG